MTIDKEIFERYANDKAVLTKGAFINNVEIRLMTNIVEEFLFGNLRNSIQKECWFWKILRNHDINSRIKEIVWNTLNWEKKNKVDVICSQYNNLLESLSHDEKKELIHQIKNKKWNLAKQLLDQKLQ